MAEIIYTNVSSNRIRDSLSQLPAMMAGRAPDAYGLVSGFKMRMAWAVTNSFVEAFIDKGRGKIDEAGESWKELSPAYLAYVRPMAKRKGHGSRQPPQAGKMAPGGREGRTNDGLLNDKQMQQWKQIFARTLARLQFQMDLSEAKQFAAAIAWNQLKKLGAKTKLQQFGTRKVQIGVDRGILLGSISPGQLQDNGADASFEFEEPEGYVRKDPGTLTVGTNVPYAIGFHKQRRLWPKPINFPSMWWDDWFDVALGGLRFAAREIARRGAA
jgi:hypothetical protein